MPLRRYASLDACRGIACLFVVAYHSLPLNLPRKVFGDQLLAGHFSGTWTDLVIWIISKMWIGVPIFFVISGYCISAAADDHQRKNRPMRTYFWRRFLRIYPPYWTLLALTTLFLLVAERTSLAPVIEEMKLAPSPTTLSAEQWLGNLTLTETWRYHVTPAKSRILIGQSWTLCSEEQFYLIIGLILCVAPRRMFAALFVLTVVIWANSMANFNVRFVRAHGWDWNALKFLRPGTFFSGEWMTFAPGIGVYYLRNHSKTGVKWTILGGMLGLLLTVVFPLSSFRNTQLAFAVALLFALLLVAFQRWDLRFAASALGRLFGAFGQISYSMYLVHFPLVRLISYLLYRAGCTSPEATLLVTIPVCVLVTTAVAALFYYCVERHFLNSPSSKPVLQS